MEHDTTQNTTTIIFNNSNTHAIRKVLSASGQITYYAITNIQCTLISAVRPVAVPLTLNSKPITPVSVEFIRGDDDSMPVQTVDTPYIPPKVITMSFMYSVLPKIHKSLRNDITKKYHINKYVKWLNDSYFIVASSKNKNKKTLLYQLFYIDTNNTIPIFISYISPIIKPTDSYPVMQLNKDSIYIESTSSINITNNKMIDIKTNKQLVLSYSADKKYKYIRDWSVNKILVLPPVPVGTNTV